MNNSLKIFVCSVHERSDELEIKCEYCKVTAFRKSRFKTDTGEIKNLDIKDEV